MEHCQDNNHIKGQREKKNSPSCHSLHAIDGEKNDDKILLLLQLSLEDCIKKTNIT